LSPVFDHACDLGRCALDGVVNRLVWAICQPGPIVLVVDRFGVSRSWSSSAYVGGSAVSECCGKIAAGPTKP
jgi:hypothetical protein